jgi:hypothetical protein
MSLGRKAADRRYFVAVQIFRFPGDDEDALLRYGGEER